jgi:hypothetical protein
MNRVLFSPFLPTSSNSAAVKINNINGQEEQLIIIIKPTRCTIYQIYFWNRTLRISDRLSVHHQESSTVFIAIGICHTGYAD